MSIIPAGWTAKQARVYIERENRKYTRELLPIPRASWPPHQDPRIIAVHRSSRFLVQTFREDDGVLRLSVNRTLIGRDGNWEDGLTWDDLNAIKVDLGYSDSFAVEIYPAERDIVNVANMRHLWILPEPLSVGWKRKA